MGPSDAGSFIELEFTVEDESYPAARMSRKCGCRVELIDATRQIENGAMVTEFFRVEDGNTERLAETGREAKFATDVSVLERVDDEHLLQVRLSRCFVGSVIDAGGVPQSAVFTDGTAHVVALVPPDIDSNSVIASITDAHPSTSLVRKQRCDVPTQFVRQGLLQAVVSKRLTDRQRTAVRLAYEGGYFERPRRRTQAELADEMDISPSTFGQHLHMALKKLLAAFFRDRTR